MSMSYTLVYIYMSYSVFSRDITMHTVIYGVGLQLWPTLDIPYLLQE